MSVFVITSDSFNVNVKTKVSHLKGQGQSKAILLSLQYQMVYQYDTFNIIT